MSQIGERTDAQAHCLWQPQFGCHTACECVCVYKCFRKITCLFSLSLFLCTHTREKKENKCFSKRKFKFFCVVSVGHRVHYIINTMLAKIGTQIKEKHLSRIATARSIFKLNCSSIRWWIKKLTQRTTQKIHVAAFFLVLFSCGRKHFCTGSFFVFLVVVLCNEIYVHTVTQTQHTHLFYRHSKVYLRVCLDAIIHFSFVFCVSQRWACVIYFSNPIYLFNVSELKWALCYTWW